MVEKNTFLFIIIVMSIFAVIGMLQIAGFPITGFGTTALGTATVNITGQLSIRLIDANISFGSGTFIAPALYAILESTNASPVNGTWNAVNDPFILENDGNVLANISIKASSSAANWFGGTASYAAMYYNYTNNETNSCLLDGVGNLTYWAVLPVNPAVNITCQKLNYTDTNDALRFDLKIQIPADAPAGLKANAITFTASQSA